MSASVLAAILVWTPMTSVADEASSDNSTLNGAIQTSDRSLAVSRARRLGAGVTVGEPTGASLKYWLNETLALDAAIGVGFETSTDLATHSDVLWHAFDVFPVKKGELPLYFGVGGRLKLQDDDDDRWGVRIPVGASYMFENAPVDVFLEVAPVIDVTPDVQGSVTAGVGVRYWF